jgi:hypothetical protein
LTIGRFALCAAVKREPTLNCAAPTVMFDRLRCSASVIVIAAFFSRSQFSSEYAQPAYVQSIEPDSSSMKKTSAGFSLFVVLHARTLVTEGEALDRCHPCRAASVARRGCCPNAAYVVIDWRVVFGTRTVRVSFLVMLTNVVT